MAVHIGAFITGVVTKRTHAPIRRNSKPAGKCEAGFWRPTTLKIVKQIVLAAKRYEIANKVPGARNGPLGVVALEVLELFANTVDFQTGRLEPSLDYIKAKLRRSRDAIVRALAALRDKGFIDWLRRFEPADNAGDGEKGPQMKQASNAYRMALPEAARALVAPHAIQEVPLPEDAEQAVAARKHIMRDMLQSFSTEERIVEVGDPGKIADALIRLARAREKQRESAKRTESLSESYI